MIPVTQYLRPNGRRKQEGIERPPEVEKTAFELIDKGVKFEAEVLTTGEVSFEAVRLDPDGEHESLAIEVVPNGPKVLEAVDKVVNDAAAFMRERGL